eukprot:7074109-Pyramimonas_sp.AAC.1
MHRQCDMVLQPRLPPPHVDGLRARSPKNSKRHHRKPILLVRPCAGARNARSSVADKICPSSPDNPCM